MPVTNIFIWTKNKVNWAAFIAGIIEGVLFSIDFPAKVIAHFADDDKDNPDSTVFQIKFTNEALEYAAKYNGDS